MQSFVSQILLPTVLAFIMLGIGQSLRIKDFSRLKYHAKALAVGLSMQVFLLPLLALIIVYALQLSSIHGAGLVLLSLCPGGATSNLFTHLARGNLALSLCLTVLSSLIIILSLPIIFSAYLYINPVYNGVVHLPLEKTVKQLMYINLVPVIVGMLVRYRFPAWAAGSKPIIKKISVAAMLLTIFALLILNPPIVKNIATIPSFSVLILSSLAIALTFSLTSVFRFSFPIRKTLAIEVGIQNAGTAMFVAVAILAVPELAMLPLTYGILMNLPAFLFIYLVNQKDRRVLLTS